MPKLTMLNQLLQSNGEDRKAKPGAVSIALAGFAKEDVLGIQVSASELPVRLVGARDCAQVCRLIESGKVRAVVIGPAIRSHDRVTIESIAGRHDTKLLSVRETDALLGSLRTMLMKMSRPR